MDKRELRIVLIGGRELGGIEASGKSSVGNTILGTDVFPTDTRTARCQKAEAETHGWKITVVDTPGWWWHYSVENTPTFDRLELIHSLSLCLPGPHVFLLVIPVNTAFPEIYRIALEEHLEFFGKDIWKRMMVVFSSVTSYDVRAFEEHLKSWPDLLWLLGKSHKMYHVLDIKKQGDRDQVSLLLDKIARIVEKLNGQHFEINTNMSVQLDKRRKAEERAQQIRIALQRQEGEMKARRLGDAHCPADLRLVIVGASWAGRSTAGNLILGTNAFDVDDNRTTVQCVVKTNIINGRQVTVVDTPGWFCNNPLEKTSERDKLEIKRSVTLCPPGPHAILLTVAMATAFNESYQKVVEEHMGLFGEDVWAHTIVLFTRGDWLGDTTIAERIATEEMRLEWLMNKCENRHHVITRKDLSDFTQTTEIIPKIDELVEGNEGRHYEMDHGVYSELCARLEAAQTTAKTNKIKVRRQRNILRTVFKEAKCDLTALRIVLLGRENAGKSSSGNTILFNTLFQETLTENFRYPKPTKKCVMHQRKVAGCLVSVVDTPGWSQSSLVHHLESIFQSVSACPPGPHAFLLVLPANQPFTKKDQQTLEAVMRGFGKRAWRHTMLLFSHGSWLRDIPIEEYIECEGEPLKWLVSKCENRYHVLDKYNWGNGSQVKHLLDKIKEMVVRNRGEHFAFEKKAIGLQEWLFGPKTLSVEEWNKREDDLIRRMLEAVWLDADVEESTLQVRRRNGSISFSIPNMKSETMSETDSLYERFGRMSNIKVSQWLRQRENYTPSSGYVSVAMCNTETHSRWGDEESSMAGDPIEDTYIPKPRQDRIGLLGHSTVQIQPRRNSF